MTQCRPINLIKRKWRADRAHRASTLSVPLSFSYRVLEAILACPAVSVTLLGPRVAGGVRLAPGCPVSCSLGSSLFSSDSCSQQAFSRKHSFCPQFTLIADFSKPFSSLPHRPSHADPLPLSASVSASCWKLPGWLDSVLPGTKAERETPGRGGEPGRERRPPRRRGRDTAGPCRAEAVQGRGLRPLGCFALPRGQLPGPCASAATS